MKTFLLGAFLAFSTVHAAEATIDFNLYAGDYRTLSTKFDCGFHVEVDAELSLIILEATDCSRAGQAYIFQCSQKDSICVNTEFKSERVLLLPDGNLVMMSGNGIRYKFKK